MKIKTLNIIGSSFYGCNLAIRLAKNKNLKINLIEKNNNIIKAWESIDINGYKVNPGFHAFEIPRSDELISFLKEFKIDFVTSNKKRGLIIEKFIEEYSYSYNNKISKILNITPKKVVTDNVTEIFKFLNKKEIERISSSFQINRKIIKNKIQMIYPWFYPKNYDLISTDEGTIFNSLIRNKNINYDYCFPKNVLFQEIRDKLRKYIDNSNINLILNKNLDLSKKPPKNTLNVVCIPIPFLLQQKSKIFKSFASSLLPQNYNVALFKFSKKYIPKFTELIILSSLLPGFRRISYPVIKNETFILIEFTSKNNLSNRILNENFKQLFKILSIDQNHLNFIGSKFVRKVFDSKSSSMSEVLNKAYSEFNQNKQFFLPRMITWPINTNKQYIYAKEDARVIQKMIYNI